jgi:hypothetical protein
MPLVTEERYWALFYMTLVTEERYWALFYMPLVTEERYWALFYMPLVTEERYWALFHMPLQIRRLVVYSNISRARYYIYSHYYNSATKCYLTGEH